MGGWTNTSCCAKGCACIAKSQYYSMCKPPTGIDDCDATMLHTQVSSAHDEVNARKGDVKTALENIEMGKSGIVEAKKLHDEKVAKAHKAITFYTEKKIADDSIADADVSVAKVKKAAHAEQDETTKKATAERVKVAKEQLAKREKVVKEETEKKEKVEKDETARKDNVEKEETKKKDTVKKEQTAKRDKVEKEETAKKDEVEKTETEKRDAIVDKENANIKRLSKDSVDKRDKLIATAHKKITF